MDMHGSKEIEKEKTRLERREGRDVKEGEKNKGEGGKTMKRGKKLEKKQGREIRERKNEWKR